MKTQLHLHRGLYAFGKKGNLQESINYLKNQHNYPKETDAHNALADAKWNKKLYEFLQNI
ncbi:3'-5' exoribonuclease [Flavobacterium sp. HSC-61S13]|uniref:3'-5' exoribonuclease n=1 Tax=Flavobacterium sp. HSC-61S13 TaxID=2910963 RepID=UPI00209F42D0|nr:3'-5' exoribonuclease [Flavobacterium sp. HSC-61S13]MCP1996673.1 hypothetical protein [Flavobacterium sp. HSC-61S13]